MAKNISSVKFLPSPLPLKDSESLQKLQPWFIRLIMPQFWGGWVEEDNSIHNSNVCDQNANINLHFNLEMEFVSLYRKYEFEIAIGNSLGIRPSKFAFL